MTFKEGFGISYKFYSAIIPNHSYFRGDLKILEGEGSFDSANPHYLHLHQVRVMIMNEDSSDFDLEKGPEEL